MTTQVNEAPITMDTLKKVTSQISPLWSLQHFVAVNPYFGLNHLSFSDADTLLTHISGSRLTMNPDFYVNAYQHQELELTPTLSDTLSHDLKSQLDTEQQQLQSNEIQTISAYISQLQQKEWQGWAIDSVSSFIATYVDEGQALWTYPRTADTTLFSAWLEDSRIDRSPEISGITNARDIFKELSTDHIDTIQFVLSELNIPKHSEELYLHRLLMQHHGWASYIRQRVWKDELNGGSNDELIQFLAILLSIEYLFFKQLSASDITAWQSSLSNLSEQKNTSPSLSMKLQQAYEKKQQDALVRKINTHIPTEQHTPPKIQAVFCIDVRSEVIRRHIESASDHIETIGFAGFFGATVRHQHIGEATFSSQCPVLLNSSHDINETLGSDNDDARFSKNLQRLYHLKKAWLGFKMGAISCFSFMGPVGVFYFPMMIKRLLGLSKRPSSKTAPKTIFGKKTHIKRGSSDTCGIAEHEQIDMAENAIRGMSLSSFGDIVLIVGHESISENNPYESALDCGACGGNSGSYNARLMCDILNDPNIRTALQERDIHIPDTTIFIPAVHNTSTDDVVLFDTEHGDKANPDTLAELHTILGDAAKATRAERSLRFMNVPKRDLDQAIFKRSVDWSQTRPEWGLAGCNAFIAAPREFTKDLDLGGRSFLHSYNWKVDKNFSILELIMTAPVVVASWINLQYYASTVDNNRFGSGNKTLHNVVSGLGVLEGSYGDLKVGLPLQSIHDGTSLQHSPERLNVCIAAPRAEILNVMAKHELVRNLFDNEWLHLFVLSDDGKVTHRYATNGQWTRVSS